MDASIVLVAALSVPPHATLLMLVARPSQGPFRELEHTRQKNGVKCENGY